MAIYDNQALYRALQELQIINEDQLDQALAISENKNLPLDQIILEKDLIADENLGKVVASLLGLPFVNLGHLSIDEEILKIIPEVVAKKQKIITFQKDQQGLHLAMANPQDLQMVEFIKKKLGLPVIVYLATQRDIQNALALYRKDLARAFEQIIAENVQQVKTAQGKATEPPIIKIVDTVISYAYQNRASDIHLEPQEESSLIRFRIDGVLYDILKLTPDFHPLIVTRIKVLAKLRTDEHQTAQDGKMQFKTEDENLDIRVSIVPISRGEKIVMRLLSERSRRFSLINLGFPESDLAKVKKAYQKPYGMILATGPTGCGKTTTMYAILKILNRRDVNIVTIEDPIEFDIQGINQIQVNPKTGLTFAKGLRSIVRQDPDIILVGEIRDKETAGIAINSAMTGHLVLSTLHTNDAATAIPRLLNMEIEPFLIASSVNVIIAQRLVRKICLKCRVSVDLKTTDLEKHFGDSLIKKHFGDQANLRIYRGKGCSLCHQTGYAGRVGIFEVLPVGDEIKQAIVDKNDAATIKEIAVRSGITLMAEDGLEKVKQGIITMEEVIRVTKE